MAVGKKKKAKNAGIKVDKAEAAARVKKIFPLLLKAYPDAKIALNFSTPLELLIATILSAQCTDTRVNIVTAELFKKYKNAKDWAGADRKEVESDIKSTGFFRNKAKNIQETCLRIDSVYGNKVPGTMEKLVSLPGVGRKTANVVLGNAFRVPGIACDTHVIRLSRRLGLSVHSDPVKLEFDLGEIVPKSKWTMMSHLLIFHGRNVCKARKPDCRLCVVSDYCSAANNPSLW